MFFVGFLVGIIMFLMYLSIYCCLVSASRASHKSEQYFIPIHHSTNDTGISQNHQPKFVKSEDDF